MKERFWSVPTQLGNVLASTWRVRTWSASLTVCSDKGEQAREYRLVWGWSTECRAVTLYRGVDSTGATIDFLLLAKRDASAAERFLAKALSGANDDVTACLSA